MSDQPVPGSVGVSPERIAASAYFQKGRCSGHAQFNGRYCRDVAPPEQWCIHCAGYMLLSALDAQQARIEALEKELAIYKASFACCEVHTPDTWEGDGTCVICEAVQLSTDRDARAATLTQVEGRLAEATAKLEKVERTTRWYPHWNGVPLGWMKATDVLEALASVSPPPQKEGK